MIFTNDENSWKQKPTVFFETYLLTAAKTTDSTMVFPRQPLTSFPDLESFHQHNTD